MDFAKKKAFETHLNKVGKDLGLGSNVTSGFGGSSGAEPRQSEWSIFPSRNNNDDVEAQDTNADASPLPEEVAAIFETRPKNFPMFIKLFYADRSILSDSALKPVTTAFRMLCLIEALLALNTFVNILFTGLNSGKGWIDLVIGALVAIVLSIYELFAYETAFRGAYRTSTNLRKRYMFFTLANIIVLSMYAFLGVSFFNGWAQIPRIADSEEGKAKGLRKGFVVVEALLWTGTVCFTIYTLFEFYHFVQGREQGLSSEAISNARRSTANDRPQEGDHIPPEVGSSRPGGGTRTDSAQIQAIKNRYRTAEM